MCAAPFGIKSPGEALYYIAFIDDFPTRTWIYFMKRKRFPNMLLEIQSGNRDGNKPASARSAHTQWR